MREMKDSGIEWIGTIPNHWKCCKQKYVIQLINGRAYSDSEFEENGKYRILRVGNLFSNPTWYTSSLELPDDKYCSDGDLLYSWSMSYAPVIWRGEKVIYHYHIWKTALGKELSKMFAYYYFISLTDALRSEIHETTMGFITMGVMNNSYIAYPEIDEQVAISNYLDEKCGEYESLISDLQAQIETLEQYKRSVITEAVTKGLDPDVEMKESGVQWIGKTPKHWSVYRIAALYAERNERGNDELPLLSVSINTGVSDSELTDEESARVFVRSEDRSKYKRVYPQDLTYNMMRAWQGAFGAVRVNGMVSPAYVVAKPLREIDTRYIEALFRTPSAIQEMHRYSYGVADFRLRLYWDKFRTIKVCFPPLEEQHRIADYIDEKASEIDAIITEKKQQIEMIEEYKKSLIFEYVTGKKEVQA